MSGFDEPAIDQYPTNRQRVDYTAGILCFILLAAAYLIHLDFIPLVTENDESRRALVTAEMMISGDYMTPTLNGELYLNKPPLYNWILAVFFKLAGGYSLFALRLPVIIATLVTGLIVYQYTRKYLGKTVAFFTAFAYMTNGRILIYDSLLGLIDTTYSLLVYLGFIWIYVYGEKKKYFHLFLLTYLVTALGFLMKGMPSLVFQAITLLTWAIWKKKFRVLFHISHFAGIGLLVLILGFYYYRYFSINNLSPADLFSNLLNESTKRTAVRWGIGDSIINILLFPFMLLYHFTPWTIFILAAFQKKILKKLKDHPFVFYSFLVLVFNLVPYWLSPQTYARYYFMFLPLLYSVLFYLFFRFIKESSWQFRTIYGIFLGFTAALALIFALLPFLTLAEDRTQIYFRCGLLAVVLGLLSWTMIRYRQYMLLAFVAAVIVFRFGFNWYIVEPRAAKFAQAESVADSIATITGGKPLYILRNSQIGNFDGMSFHISTRRNEILRFSDDPIPGTFYITDSAQVRNISYDNLLSFTNYLADPLMLVRIKEKEPAGQGSDDGAP